MGAHRLNIRLWELLTLIMKTILALDNIIDDTDMAVTNIINQNKMR